MPCHQGQLHCAVQARYRPIFLLPNSHTLRASPATCHRHPISQAPQSRPGMESALPCSYSQGQLTCPFHPPFIISYPTIRVSSTVQIAFQLVVVHEEQGLLSLVPQRKTRPETSAWHLVATQATDIDTDPNCSMTTAWPPHIYLCLLLLCLQSNLSSECMDSSASLSCPSLHYVLHFISLHNTFVHHCYPQRVLRCLSPSYPSLAEPGKATGCLSLGLHR